jgi:hypothetical protein
MVEWGKKTQRQRQSVVLKEAVIKEFGEIKTTKSGTPYMTVDLECIQKVGVFDKRETLEQLMKDFPVGTKLKRVKLNVSSGFLNLEKFEPTISEEGLPEDIKSDSNSSSAFVPLGICSACGERTLTFREELRKILALKNHNCVFCYYRDYRDLNEEN